MIKHIPAAAKNCKLIQWYKHLSGRGHEVEAEVTASIFMQVGARLKISLRWWMNFKACKNFIKWNFQFVAESDDFVEIDSTLLINILLEDDMVVYDEYSLFQ